MKNIVDYFNFTVFKYFPKDIDFWIAGGAVRDVCAGLKVTSDIDCWFKTEAHALALGDWLDRHGAKQLYSWPVAVGYLWHGYHYQIVLRFFESPQTTIDAFDFTVCAAAVTKDGFVCHPTFWQDLAARRLIIHNLPMPLATLKRVVKYTQKGYTICDAGLLTLSRAIAATDMSDTTQNVFERYPGGGIRFVRFD